MHLLFHLSDDYNFEKSSTLMEQMKIDAAWSVM